MSSILVSDTVASHHGDALTRAAPDRTLAVLRGEEVEGDLGDVEIAFFSWDLYPARVGPFARSLVQCKQLRWLQTFNAGIDNPFFQGMLDRGIRLSTGSGANAVPIAQTVMLYLLALSRDLPGWLAAQRERRWESRHVEDLQGRLLGVLGLGPIGIEVAKLGQAFGMRVIGVRRTPRGDEPCETWSFDRIDELLAAADDLVLALPLTPETHHLIDARALARMKRGARLVNVGRGELVDEAALASALASGQIGGAGLDVFEAEPLPAESPLWSLPNVIVTPHSSGTTPGNADRTAAIFLENLPRYLAGEPLHNEIRP